MVLLVATPLGGGGGFRYTIQRKGYGIIFSSQHRFAVAAELSRLTDEEPEALLSQARNRGAVEVVEREAAP